MRAALYARFSSDLQNERSIEDQFALCRSYAERNGLTVVRLYEDRAKSGASLVGRAGLMALMQDAREHAFDAVIVEALDRIARDQEDMPHVWKRLRHQGVDILAVHEGKADAVQIGVRGLVSALFLTDLAHKVRRGQAGMIRQGKIPAGLTYGYRAVRGEPGRRSIDAGEAAIVRRIFQEYAEGQTPRAIAAGLNRDGLAPPRGARWNASTLNGSRTRNNGILQNEIYIGRVIWNRLRMVKDPDTGKRVSRPNPPEQWQVLDAPELALVDQALWDAVRARKGVARKDYPHRQRTPPRLLSGLLRCGVCGAGMASQGRDTTGKTRVRCSRHRESGACAHGRIYYLEQIEETAVSGLRESLRDPRLIARYVAAYHEERRRLAADSVSERARLERRNGEIARELERLVDAIAQGAGVEALRQRMLTLEAERIGVETSLVRAEPAPEIVTLHPTAIARYLEQLERLAETMSGRTAFAADEKTAAFRALVSRVTVHPVPAFAPLDIEITGSLAELVKDPAAAPLLRSGGTVVAPAGFEPATKGL